MKPTLSAMALAAACAAPSMAWATVEGHATFSDLSYTLIDLDPDDGLAPWIEFEPLSQDKRRVSTYIIDWQGQAQSEYATPASYGSGAVSAVLRNASGSAGVSGNGGPIGTGASAEGRVVSDVAHPSAGFSVNYAAMDGRFLLSPQTRVVWTARYHLDVAVEMSSTDRMSEFATASTMMTLYDERHLAQDWQNAIVGGAAQHPAGPDRISRDGELIFAWDNIQKADSSRVSYQWLTQLAVSVVPEPSSLGLIAFGAPLVMAWAVRRRRRAA